MQLGDMVQRLGQSAWENRGLGIITEIDDRPCYGGAVQVTWLEDILDVGWDKAISDWAEWFERADFDFQMDVAIFSEVKDESR